MRIAAGLALLLAPATLVRGYICNYRATGSTSAFPTFVTLAETCTFASNYPYCSGIYYSNCDANGCQDPWSSRIQNTYAHGTCCQCAPATGYNWCTAVPPTWDPATELPPADFDTWQTQGCDAYRPDIYYDSSAAQAYTPGEWFTDVNQLNNYLRNTVKCEDDCDVGGGLPQNPTNTVCDPTTANCCGYQVALNCANTAITLSSTDACGNVNTQGPYFVRADFAAPAVTVTVPEFTVQKYKYKWEKLDVFVNITDNCDPNPLTSITVYSDEAGLTKETQPVARLSRNYASPATSVNATLNGWDVTLWRYRQAVKSCDLTDFSCLAANGRFYVVRVCAEDQAGIIFCNEDTVGVPPKGWTPASKHVWNPVYDGKLFVVAEDLAYWNLPPTELPPRARNTGLNQV